MTWLTLKGYPDPLPDVLIIDLADYADFCALGYRPVAVVFNEHGRPSRDLPIVQDNKERKNEGKR